MSRLIKLLFLSLVAVVALSVEAEAQSIQDKCGELAVRTMDGAVVHVVESHSVESAVYDVESKVRRRDVDGYRVVIFSDNGQYAGDNARKVLENFQQTHPHINAYMVYESPYFKVSVGDCLTLEEASHLMSQLDSEYPDLFPKRESISFEALASVRPHVRELPDSLPALE
ncbi:MAG: hypothetical protein J6V26_05130 [Alistipes sp.]|nr:hypothetical protein [Alistipes sp.]